MLEDDSAAVVSGSRWLIPEPELVPYRAEERVAASSLLVLAPHPDDEVFGCGGLLSLAARQGVAAAVVVLTDGAVAGDAVAREAECRQAAEVIGYAGEPAALQFWRLPDRGLVPDELLVTRLRELLRTRCPQWLLAPSPFEVHPDHRAASRGAIEAVAGSGVQLGFYEVGQPLMANRLFDITPVLATKQRAMACFPSQLAMQRYDEQLLALNRYRAFTLGPAVSHAEAYWFPHGAGNGVDAVLAEAGRLLSHRLGWPEA